MIHLHLENVKHLSKSYQIAITLFNVLTEGNYQHKWLNKRDVLLTILKYLRPSVVPVVSDISLLNRPIIRTTHWNKFNRLK
jgi:hypothetical protein